MTDGNAAPCKMKPELKFEMIRKQYWGCSYPDHRHQTEDVASDCIENRHFNEDYWVKFQRKRAFFKERDESIFRRYREGEKQNHIAFDLGLSPERIRQVIQKAIRQEQRSLRLQAAGFDASFELLSVKTRNVLGAEGFYTVEQVWKGLEDRALYKTPNIGDVTREEIRDWLLNVGRK